MADLAAARANMVDSQARTADVTDVRIHDAMREVAREALLAADKAHLAYADIEAEYAPGRWLLKPRDVAKLLQALRPMPGERVLAISAPYAAAVIAHMGLGVTQADAGEPPPAGLFDVILCEGAVGRAPVAWLQRLAPGGRLGLVERDGPVGKACLYVRAADAAADATGQGIGRRDLFDATPPVLPGFALQHGFAF